MQDPQLKPFNGEASSKVVRRSERFTEVQVIFPWPLKGIPLSGRLAWSPVWKASKIYPLEDCRVEYVKL